MRENHMGKMPCFASKSMYVFNYEEDIARRFNEYGEGLFDVSRAQLGEAVYMMDTASKVMQSFRIRYGFAIGEKVWV